MKNSIKTISLTALTVALIGCGATQPAMPTLAPVNIATIDGYNAAQSNISNSKLLVAPGQKSDIPAHLQGNFANVIKEIITESGSEVIDRNLANRFIEEIQLKENLSENYNEYEGPVEARFAIIPTITSVSYGSEYEASYSRKGKSYPAECDYKGSVKGNVQIRELPSMKQLLSLNVHSQEVASQENPRSRSCNDKGLINGVINKAISSLLVKGHEEYTTFSKYVGSQGVITGARSHDGKLFFETNLGRLNGAKEAAQVAIYQEIDGELVLIAEGEMLESRNVLQKKSYIEVDQALASTIKRGMTVMLSGKCSGLICSMNSKMKEYSKALSK